jgi:hypothetical protein
MIDDFRPRALPRDSVKSQDSTPAMGKLVKRAAEVFCFRLHAVGFFSWPLGFGSGKVYGDFEAVPL